MDKRAGGQADERTGGRGLRVDEQTGGLTSAQADEGSGPVGGRGLRPVGGQADKRTGQTVEDGFPKGRTPKLTRQLTWLSEIQRGRPWVTV